MKIESRGFRVTDICPQIPTIEVDSEGILTLTVYTIDGLSSTDPMSRDQLEALHEAVLAVRARLDDERGVTRSDDALPERVMDDGGDVWTLIHDNRYFIESTARRHRDCPASCPDGLELEYIKERWGPVEILP